MRIRPEQLIDQLYGPPPKKGQKNLEDFKKKNLPKPERPKAEALLELAEKAQLDLQTKLDHRAHQFNLPASFKLEAPIPPDWLSEKHLEALKDIFGQQNLEPMPLPSPDTLDDPDYQAMMYPKEQNPQDQNQGLISYRSSWWNESAQEITQQPETWGQAYIRSLKEELTQLKNSFILIESIPKPNYTDGGQHYGTKDGQDPQQDPLLPIFQETFGQDKNRFNYSHDELTEKLLPQIKRKIIDQFQKQNLNFNPDQIQVTLTPAHLFNLQTSLNQSQNSQTNTWEWSSTPLLDKNNQDSGHRLNVGYSDRGGAANVDNDLRGDHWDSGGARLAVVFRSWHLKLNPFRLKPKTWSFQNWAWNQAQFLV